MKEKVSCHVKKCSKVRDIFHASRERFHCEHASHFTTPEIYSVFSFSMEEIISFTPEKQKQIEIRTLNDNDIEYPVVIKISENNYAIKLKFLLVHHLHTHM